MFTSSNISAVIKKKTKQNQYYDTLLLFISEFVIETVENVENVALSTQQRGVRLVYVE